ncbi:hypothetical protein BaRGS_00021160 [Batillaria attramentaria]|uniref:Uncharacterized protein n=1 Tax=Batillaria attramentaria TaxID=370345 RepID=A0ABD0KKU7_9CAEN
MKKYHVSQVHRQFSASRHSLAPVLNATTFFSPALERDRVAKYFLIVHFGGSGDDVGFLRPRPGEMSGRVIYKPGPAAAASRVPPGGADRETNRRQPCRCPVVIGRLKEAEAD